MMLPDISWPHLHLTPALEAPPLDLSAAPGFLVWLLPLVGTIIGGVVVELFRRYLKNQGETSTALAKALSDKQELIQKEQTDCDRRSADRAGKLESTLDELNRQLTQHIIDSNQKHADLSARLNQLERAAARSRGNNDSQA